ncbi:hypothetical protein [Nocardiopsis ganjiahuensis]|uniref:hypothetical protein n=1 Tax=Nocardiopsis ganjiahuensis TaxID=239984 RepID=UPI000347F1AB|nr:hypothetical protein [Nocardiopsis ganjiahuensis]
MEEVAALTSGALSPDEAGRRVAERDRVFVSWQEEAEPGEYTLHNHAWHPNSGEDVLPDGLDHYRAVPHPHGEVIAAVTADDGLDLLDPDTFEVVGTIVD